MKIIFLNVWHGQVKGPFVDFITEQSRDTDIFCFQEAYDEMKSFAGKILSDYREISAFKAVTKDDNFPQAIYVKKDIPILSSGTVLEAQEGLGLGLYVQIRHADGDLFICNFHGMSRPVDKLDDSARVRQSQGLIDFFKDKGGAKIIGGDFNLLPETKSITMFPDAGYRDLINEYAITNTRNNLAWAMYPNNKQYYSDYAFVTPGIRVKSFAVPYIEISDHLPLILEIE